MRGIWQIKCRKCGRVIAEKEVPSLALATWKDFPEGIVARDDHENSCCSESPKFKETQE